MMLSTYSPEPTSKLPFPKLRARKERARVSRRFDCGPVLLLDTPQETVAPDEEAQSAFDRRPPLEAMSLLWLKRSGVVTVYDLGHDATACGSVYEAVFRINEYVIIRSPAPVLRGEKWAKEASDPSENTH